MEKNTVWTIVLSSIVLIGFMVLQNYMFPAKNPVNVEENTEIVQTTEVNQTSASNQNTQISNSQKKIEVTKVTSNEKESHFEIKTNKADIILTNKGGDIISYKLTDHDDGINQLQMADSTSDFNRACSISFGNAASDIINEIFSSKKIDDLTYEFSKDFTVKNVDGSDSSFTLVKTYQFHEDDYLFNLTVSVLGDENMKMFDFNNASYTLRTSPQIGPHYDKKKDRYENRTFMSFTGDKKKKQVMNDGQMKSYDKAYTWTGVAGKYFTFLAVPMAPVNMGEVVYSTKLDENNYANAQVMLTRKPITERSVKDTYYIYAGPRTEKDLKIYNSSSDNSWKLSGLRLNDSLNTSGILSWLEIAMKWVMEIIYKIIPNWGVAIIIMTLLLRLVLFPLTKKSSEATLNMQEMQPKIQEVQDKYKANPEKMNVEMAKLYKETGYNPLTGCLPVLIQFPLIIAMFNLFNNYFEFRGAMFIPGWIPDLSIGDSVYSLKFSIPFIGSEIRILPIIYLVSQLFYGKLTSNGGASAGQTGTQMKLMMYAMPIIFFFLFYNSPSGLLIYWTVSNLLTMVQQIIINNMMKAKKLEIAKQKENEIPVFVPRKKK